ncbi:Transcription factor bHLH95, partial [Mucuna pruriens]
MVEDQGSHDMDFLLENHSSGSSNTDNSGENEENMKSPNEKKEGEPLMNKKPNQEIATENKEKTITSGEGTDAKYPESDHEIHLSIERQRRKKMKDMFATLHALLPPLPTKICK